MDIREAIYTRRAVREFKPDPVDPATLRELVYAAIQAPSAMNRQPWSFVIVRDKALLARISNEAKALLLETTPAGLLSHHLEETLGSAAFDIFYHAPAMIVIAAVAESPWAVADCALAAQNLMLAARAAELGTCWIGFAQGWLSTPEGKSALGIPASHVPVAPIIVGHPSSQPPAVARKAPEIHWVG
jgi:nitroreductase